MPSRALHGVAVRPARHRRSRLPRGAPPDRLAGVRWISSCPRTRSRCRTGCAASATGASRSPWCAAWPTTGGVDRARWRELGDLGRVLAAPARRADGGAELGWADAVLAFEELGRALVPGPAGVDPPAGRPRRRRGPGRGRSSAAWIATIPAAWSSTPTRLDVLAVLDDDGRVGRRSGRPRHSSRVASPLDPLTPVARLTGAAAPGRAAGRRRRPPPTCAGRARR